MNGILLGIAAVLVLQLGSWIWVVRHLRDRHLQPVYPFDGPSRLRKQHRLLHSEGSSHIARSAVTERQTNIDQALADLARDPDFKRMDAQYPNWPHADDLCTRCQDAFIRILAEAHGLPLRAVPRNLVGHLTNLIQAIGRNWEYVDAASVPNPVVLLEAVETLGAECQSCAGAWTEWVKLDTYGGIHREGHQSRSSDPS